MLDRIGRTGLVLAFVIASATACSETGPTQPGGSGADLEALTGEPGTLGVEGLTSQVSGVGQQWASAPGGEMQPALRRFTVNAQKHADGTVTGHHNIVTASGLHIEGVVTCLNVVGDRAFIGGTFRNAQPAPPFTAVGVALEVVDGGSGPAAVDQISPFGIFAAELGATEADVQAFCDDAIPGPVSPIDMGSINVN